MKKNNCKRRRKTVNSGISQAWTRDRRHQGVNEFENREISPRSQLESWGNPWLHKIKYSDLDFLEDFKITEFYQNIWWEKYESVKNTN